MNIINNRLSVVLGVCIGFAGTLPVHAQSAVSRVAAQCEVDACGCELVVGNYIEGSARQVTELSALVRAIENYAGQTSVTGDRVCYSVALQVIANRVTAFDPALGSNLFDLAAIVAAGPFEPGEALAGSGSPTGATVSALGNRGTASSN